MKPMETIDVLDTLNKSCDQMLDDAFQLHELSIAAGRLGMVALSQDLHAVAVSIEKSQKRLHGLGGPIAHSTMRVAQEASTNMIQAALAGIELASSGADT